MGSCSNIRRPTTEKGQTKAIMLIALWFSLIVLGLVSILFFETEIHEIAMLWIYIVVFPLTFINSLLTVIAFCACYHDRFDVLTYEQTPLTRVT